MILPNQAWFIDIDIKNGIKLACLWGLPGFESTGLFLSLWIFFENTITPSFCYGIVLLFGMLLIMSNLQLSFYTLFQNVDYFWANMQIWWCTSKFFAKIHADFLFLRFLVLFNFRALKFKFWLIFSVYLVIQSFFFQNTPKNW